MTEPRIAELLQGVAAHRNHLADCSRGLARLADLLQEIQLKLRDEHDHEQANRVWAARERTLAVMREMQLGAARLTSLMGGAEADEDDQTDRFVRAMLVDDD